mmetsp:Transcript_10187/g.31328  ORF Transcript_10187/g.31328 Transcript_10187/m.31328 type:complete len:247 (+) Transcript_10187:2029-2769(+)
MTERRIGDRGQSRRTGQGESTITANARLPAAAGKRLQQHAQRPLTRAKATHGPQGEAMVMLQETVDKRLSLRGKVRAQPAMREYPTACVHQRGTHQRQRTRQDRMNSTAGESTARRSGLQRTAQHREAPSIVVELLQQCDIELPGTGPRAQRQTHRQRALIQLHTQEKRAGILQTEIQLHWIIRLVGIRGRRAAAPQAHTTLEETAVSERLHPQSGGVLAQELQYAEGTQAEPQLVQQRRIEPSVR